MECEAFAGPHPTRRGGGSNYSSNNYRGERFGGSGPANPADGVPRSYGSPTPFKQARAFRLSSGAACMQYTHARCTMRNTQCSARALCYTRTCACSVHAICTHCTCGAHAAHMQCTCSVNAPPSVSCACQAGVRAAGAFAPDTCWQLWPVIGGCGRCARSRRVGRSLAEAGGLAAGLSPF